MSWLGSIEFRFWAEVGLGCRRWQKGSWGEGAGGQNLGTDSSLIIVSTTELKTYIIKPLRPIFAAFRNYHIHTHVHLVRYIWPNLIII